MKEIPLTQGLVALVDDGDYQLVSPYKWYARKERNTYYSLRNSEPINGKRRTILMHRVIMDAPPGMEVDHRDGNGLNNVRANLRLATSQQNGLNKRVRKDSKSGVKGVYWVQRSRLWKASIRIDNQRIALGYFPTAELAHKAYAEAAVKYHGEFARVE